MWRVNVLCRVTSKFRVAVLPFRGKTGPQIREPLSFMVGLHGVMSSPPLYGTSVDRRCRSKSLRRSRTWWIQLSSQVHPLAVRAIILWGRRRFASNIGVLDKYLHQKWMHCEMWGLCRNYSHGVDPLMLVLSSPHSADEATSSRRSELKNIIFDSQI